MKEKERILLIGGNGFIGKNIIEQLSDKYYIIAPRRTEIDFRNTDDVFHFLQNEKISKIINSANTGGKRTCLDLQNITHDNLKIFFNLVRAEKFYQRLIILGSGAEYDKTRDIKMIKEDAFDSRVPSDQYGFYKYVCSKYAEQSDKILHLRLFGVFGKYEDYKLRFISQAICSALFDQPIIINQNVLYDYLYIDDFVKILDNLISKKATLYKFYNIGRGEGIELLSVAKKILIILNKNLEIKIVEPGLNFEYTCNVDRMLNEVDIKFTDLDNSLATLIDYYKSILSTLDSKTLIY